MRTASTPATNSPKPKSPPAPSSGVGASSPSAGGTPPGRHERAAPRRARRPPALMPGGTPPGVAAPSPPPSAAGDPAEAEAAARPVVGRGRLVALGGRIAAGEPGEVAVEAGDEPVDAHAEEHLAVDRRVHAPHLAAGCRQSTTPAAPAGPRHR